MALLLLIQATACVVGVRPSLAGKVDLRAFYAAGAIIRSGHGSQLYDYNYQAEVQNALVGPRAEPLPFLYPAFAALPFVPLSRLSYRAAFFTMLLINIGLLAVAASLLHKRLRYFSKSNWLAVLALYGCLFGVSIAFMQGQISLALLVVYCGTWVLLQDKRHFLAGLLMSLGLAKFQIAIPLFLLFCIWRHWRVTAGFITGATTLAGISIAIIGKAGAMSYWHSMAGMTKQTALNASAAKVHYGMFPVDMPNLHGLTFGLSRGATWGLGLNIILCCGVMIFAARQKPSLLVALPAAMLVSYHMQPHDLTLLILPLSFGLDELVRRIQRRRAGDRLALRSYDIALLASLALLVLPLAAVVMAIGMNYLVALVVTVVMVYAAKTTYTAKWNLALN